MLQSRNLDDQRFEEIMEHAIGRIPQLCPQWTNHNPADPGITLLELLAWYKEMQQYHMNACTDDIRRKLLLLAGGDVRPAAAARCGVRPFETGIRYPALSRMETPEGVVFELLEEIPARCAILAGCYVCSGQSATEVSAMLDRRYAGVQPFAFGGGRTEFVLAFSDLTEKSLRLWFEVRQPQLPARNPFRDPDQCPRVIRWQWEGAGAATVLQDETHALSQSGYITFSVPAGLEKTTLPGMYDTFWHLRATLEDPGCEETVNLSAVETGRWQAEQRETWSRSHTFTAERDPMYKLLFDDALAAVAAFTVFLRTEEGWQQTTAVEITEDGKRGVLLDTSSAVCDGAANLRVVCSDPIHYADLFHHSSGLPDQAVTLDLRGQQALPERFCLICDTLLDDGTVRPQVWRCVEDLYAAGPRDRVFVYDPDLEQIRFGNGRTGAVVPQGENAIFLADLTLCACAAGNIPEGDRLRFAESGASLWNTAARGGADRETTSQAAARFLQRLESPNKCTSARDYELQAMKTSGLRVAAARAIPGYDPLEPTGSSRHPVVTVVVIPASHAARPMPDRRFLLCVREHLERLRPIGTNLRVMAPQYIGITLSVQIQATGSLEQRVLERATEDCFAVGKGGRGIGDIVPLQDVAAAMQQVPGVLAVERIQFYADSAACTQTAEGDICLPRTAVAYLRECRVTIR